MPLVYNNVTYPHLDQAEQVILWSTFVARVKVCLPFRVDVIVRAFEHDDERAELAVRLHVPDRDTREPITVDTRRPCPPWTDDAVGTELVFDLLDVALRHEIHESVRLDGELVKNMHARATNVGPSRDPGDLVPG